MGPTFPEKLEDFNKAENQIINDSNSQTNKFQKSMTDVGKLYAWISRNFSKKYEVNRSLTKFNK